MRESIHLNTAGDTCPGSRRFGNDDRFLIRPLDDGRVLAAVSDGLGGHPGGYLAAETIMEVFRSVDCSAPDPAANLAAAMRLAETRIHAHVRKITRLYGMGATAVAALVGRNRVHWAHAGDSRLYRLSAGRAEQITTDHSFLQDLLESGDIEPQEAIDHPLAHVLDQCVGCLDDGPDRGTFAVNPGDRLLLCTDGLHQSVGGRDIAAIAAAEPDPVRFVSRLIRTARRNGADDDITVVAVELSPVRP